MLSGRSTTSHDVTPGRALSSWRTTSSASGVAPARYAARESDAMEHTA